MVIKPSVDPYKLKSYDYNLRYDGCVVLVHKSLFDMELPDGYKNREWISGTMRQSSVNNDNIAVDFVWIKDTAFFDDPYYDVHNVYFSDSIITTKDMELIKFPDAFYGLVPYKLHNIFLCKNNGKTQRKGICSNTQQIYCSIKPELQILNTFNRSNKAKNLFYLSDGKGLFMYVGDIIANKSLCDIPIPIAEDMVLSGNLLSARVNNEMEIGLNAKSEHLGLYRKGCYIGHVENGYVSTISDSYNEVVVENGGKIK